MKKLVLGLILVAGLFTTISAYAETLAAGRVNVGSVKNIISRKYTAEIDEDGDIAIETDNGLIYITVIKDAKLLRIFSVYKPYSSRSVAETIVLANQFNNDKRFLRVYVRENGGSSCDYYLAYDGGLNDTNLLETVDWFSLLETAWGKYLVNGGDED